VSERNDTETQSYREEQGKRAAPDARERIADVPLAPSSAGIVGEPRRRGESPLEADRDAAAERDREREAEHREVM
jgi:hypothetical protein